MGNAIGKGPAWNCDGIAAASLVPARPVWRAGSGLDLMLFKLSDFTLVICTHMPITGAGNLNVRAKPEPVRHTEFDEAVDDTERSNRLNPLFWAFWGGGAIWAAIIWWLV